MIRRLLALAGALALIAWVVWVQFVPAGAQQPARVAFVVGNAEYAKSPLPTALNDAGLVAEALRTVGLEVIEGANLNQADFFASFRDFLAKAEAAGPDAVLFIYLSGYGFAFDGENYFVAIDAKLDRESDVPLYTMRLSDLIRSLDGMPARTKVVAVDAARRLPFPLAATGLPPGLIAIEAPQNMLIGFSAAPGQIVADTTGSYGPYATAIAEMVRAAGLDIAGAFTRIRARTHQLTEGRQTPWEVAALSESVVLVPAEAAAVAPAPAMPVATHERRPFREIGPKEAYAVAIERDELPVYVEFVETYPHHPYAARIWAIIRARREALAWRRAARINTPQAYWTYLQRYPNGIYAAFAERRLRRLSAPFQPPPDFVPVEFADVPPPLADEPVEIVDFVPPAPPPPIILIEPGPAYFVDLPPPPPPVWRGGLPAVSVLPIIPRVAPGVRVPVAARPGFHDGGRGRRPPPQGAIAVPPGPPPTGPQGGGASPGPGAGRRPGGSPAPGSTPTTIRPGAPAVVTAPAEGSPPPSQNNAPPRGRRHGIRTGPPAGPPSGQATTPAGRHTPAAQPPASGPSAPVATAPAAGSPSPPPQSVASPRRGRRQGARTAPPPGSPPVQAAPPPGSPPVQAAPGASPGQTTPSGVKPGQAAPPSGTAAPQSRPPRPSGIIGRQSPPQQPAAPSQTPPPGPGATARPGPVPPPAGVKRPPAPPPSAVTKPAPPPPQRPSGDRARRPAPSPPPPAAMRRVPPPSVAAKPPSPPAAMRRAPPPPPGAVAKPVPPPPPAGAVAKPTPAPPQAAAGPPAGRPGRPPPGPARGAPGPKRAGKKCLVVNGVEVCR
jgi:uncharacterized caspase-like protein